MDRKPGPRMRPLIFRYLLFFDIKTKTFFEEQTTSLTLSHAYNILLNAYLAIAIYVQISVQ